MTRRKFAKKEYGNFLENEPLLVDGVRFRHIVIARWVRLFEEFGWDCSPYTPVFPIDNETKHQPALDLVHSWFDPMQRAMIHPAALCLAGDLARKTGKPYWLAQSPLAVPVMDGLNAIPILVINENRNKVIRYFCDDGSRIQLRKPLSTRDVFSGRLVHAFREALAVGKKSTANS